MRTYVENRIWLLGYEVRPTIGEGPWKVETEAWGVVELKRSPRVTDLDANYENGLRPITVELSEVAKQALFAEQRRRAPGFEPFDILLRLLPPGFLNIVVCYTIPADADSLTEIEKAGMLASEALDEKKVVAQLERVFGEAKQQWLLDSTALGVLGVPKSLKDREDVGYSAMNTYLYNQHLFCSTTDGCCSNWVRELDAKAQQYQQVVVHHSWAFCIWQGPWKDALSAQDATELLAMDSLGLMESCLFDSATACYTALLTSAERSPVSASERRRIITRHRYMLQVIRLWKRNLSTEQVVYLQHYAQYAGFDDKERLLDAADASLRFAIEGAESERVQRAERTTQLILAGFTALALYSCFSDVLSILSTAEPTSPQQWRVELLLLLTGAIVLALWRFSRRVVH